MPTPGGVPVAITSPGCKVIIWLREETMKAQEKIIDDVFPVCIRMPLTSSVRARDWGSGTSDGVTSHGPIGPNVSLLLPLVHWPERLIW